ncbi:hypothetical protein TYRP_020981 [Tyrophagus putrescentiae]|nr:hypothetical protein TYRP_020981 [Tyrophagus putrescentiae]
MALPPINTEVAEVPTSTGAGSFSLLKLSKLLLANKLNFWYTFFIFVNHFAYGVTVNILGATLVDLRFIYGVSLDRISYVPIAVSIGYLLGSLAGLLYKRFLNRQLMLVFFTFSLAITITFVPFYSNLTYALIALTILGLGDGGYDAASSVLIIEMWSGSASESICTAMLQALQAMYGAGSIVAPILAAPFVHGEATSIAVPGDNNVQFNQTLTVQRRIDDLVLPFAVDGFLQVIAPVVFTILLFVRPTFRRSSSFSKLSSSYEKGLSTSPTITTIVSTPSTASTTATVITTTTTTTSATSTNSSTTSLDVSLIPNRKAKLALCSLCLATYASAEFGWFAFSTAWLQYLEKPLTATESAHVMSVLAGTFTAGRLVTAFISMKISSDAIIAYHYVVCLASFAFLYLGRNHLLLIYLGTAALGYGFSALWPAWFSFTEKYLKLTDKVSSCFSFLFGVTSLLIPFVMGQLFERYPIVLLIIEVAFLCFSLVLFAVIKLWIARDESEARKGKKLGSK